MRFRDFTICLIAVILALTLFVTGGSQLDYINKQRVKLNLISNKKIQDAPPSLAFATVAMGAFRGLIVDALWIRADKLKQQGQFFDAKQLAEWITTLQPRFASVWEFRAWNMAYNIAVAIPATRPEERWTWVKNGCELLRDKGIPLNPKAIILYRELARIYQNKIGDVMDEANKYYKIQLVNAMEPLLGNADKDFFDKLANAPTKWSQIIKDPDIDKFVDALIKADDSFKKQPDFVNSYLALRQNPDMFEPQAFKVIDAYRGTSTLRKFDIFAKAFHLRNTCKLEPKLMQQINEKYGPIDWNDPNNRLPLDWRHPDTHAIYWAVKGLKEAHKGRFSIDETNTDRILVHSLQNLFINGKIYLYDYTPEQNPAPGQYMTPEEQIRISLKKDIYLRQDLRMFEPYNEAALAIIDKYKFIPKSGTLQSFKDGHRNMLENAAFSFYQSGHQQQALKIYKELGRLYPRKSFDVPLVQFIKKHFVQELKAIGLRDAKELVQMLLRESYFRYAMHDDDQADAREKMAKQVHQFYQSKYSDTERIKLPDYSMVKYFALRDFLNDRQYPPELRKSLLGRIELEQPKLYENLKQQEQFLRQKIEELQSEKNSPNLDYAK